MNTNIDYEDLSNSILTNFGTFVKETTGVSSLFLLDNDWPKLTQDCIGLQIVMIEEDGWGYIDGRDESNKLNSRVGFRVTMDVLAIRDRVEKRGNKNVVTMSPMSVLWQLSHALQGGMDSKFKYLYSKDIGFLDSTPPSRVGTVLDGVAKERRARMTVFLHCIVQDTDGIEVGVIENVFINCNINNRAGTVESSWNDYVFDKAEQDIINTVNRLYRFINFGLPLDGSSTWINKWASAKK